MFICESANDFGQQVRSNGWQYSKLDPAAQFLLQVLNLATGFIHFTNNPFGARLKQFTRSSQDGLLPEPFEELFPQFIFELKNLLAQGRLGHMALFRGTAEAPCSGEGNK